MTKLSVALTTFNEEKNVKNCLESVKWVNEIVVVDEKSSDKTVEITKKYTNKIFLVDHDPMFHKNKQLALDKCTGNWILQIDADERVTPELKSEIIKTIENAMYIGYQIPRKNKIFGKYLEHTGWYPDYQIKLFKNGKGKFLCKSVHELIEIDGEIGTMKSDLLHEHYKSIEQFIDRMNRYTTNDAEFLDKPVFWTDAIRFPFDEFLQRFFYWEGYKDGLHGLVLSLLQSFSRLIVFAKLWEKQEFFETGVDLRAGIINESKKVAKDWYYWLTQTEKNPVKKLLYKIQKRFLR